MGIITLTLWLGMGLLTAYIASAKRRTWPLWLILGLCIPIVGLLAVIGMPVKQPTRQQVLRSGYYRECPACREVINAQASKCPRCQSDVVPIPRRGWLDRLLSPNPQS